MHKKIIGAAAAMMLMAGIFLPCSSSEAAISMEERAQLKTPHSNLFYLCQKKVNVNTQEKKEQARQLVITGKDYQMAMALLNFVIKNDPDDSEAFILRALLHTDRDEFIEADRDYESALILEPENPTFYYLRGMSFLYEKKKNGHASFGWREPSKMFAKALELEPNYVDAIVGMGDSCIYEPKNAIDWYNKVLVIFPNHDIVLAKKEDAQKELKKIEERDKRRKLERRIN